MGQPYSGTVEATGGTGAYTWEFSPGYVSPGFVLNAQTGAITGSPTTWGNLGISIQVRDSGTPPQTAQAGLAILVAQPLVIIGSVGNGTRGVPYTKTFQATGGFGNRQWSILEGSLPPGLTMTANSFEATITGTPTQSGNFDFKLQVSETGPPAQATILSATLEIDTALTILSTALQYAVQGRPYSHTPTFVNGTAPFQWSAIALPQGFSINSATGEITGTPQLAFFTRVDLHVTDSSAPPQIAIRSVDFQIFGRLGASESSWQWTINIGDQRILGASPSGGVPPVVFSLQGGTLPPGMSLDALGRITGSPLELGTFKFGVTLTDSAEPPQVYHQPAAILVLPKFPRITTPPPLPTGNTSQPYSLQMQAIDGAQPYSWHVHSGRLPTGLTLSSSGLISGTPQVPEITFFAIRLTDSSISPQMTAQHYSMEVRSQPLGRNDTVATASSAGNGSRQASISPYSDPVELGTPDTDYYKLIADAEAIVQLRVSAFSQFFAPPLDSVMEIVDANGVRFQTCRDPGNDFVPSFIAVDTTPEAFDDECLNDDRQIGNDLNSELGFRVPGTAGSQTTFFVRILDFRGDARADMNYQLIVSGAVNPLIIETSGLAPAALGVTYDQFISVQGGTGTRTLTLASGSGPLPPGLSLSPTSIVGTPTARGDYPISLQVTDSGSPHQSAQRGFVVRVADPIKITLDSLPPAITGVPYLQEITTSGGHAERFWSFVSGQWCCLQFSNGIFSGTPQVAGTFTGFVSVGDGASGDSKTYTLNVSAGPLYVSNTALDMAKQGLIYSDFLQALGGILPYQWTVTSGSLPPGTSLNSATGEVRGIPTASGDFSFTVQVVDSSSPQKSATTSVVMTVVP